jgi:hypothetical protein
MVVVEVQLFSAFESGRYKSLFVEIVAVAAQEKSKSLKEDKEAAFA